MEIGHPYRIGERTIETPDWEKSEPRQVPSQPVPEREREKVPAK